MKVYRLDEITDSKLLYDKKPPKFMIYIILSTVMLMTGFIIWSCVSVKTYVVKGQGLVTTESKNDIMAKVSGEIKASYLEEGKEVKKGDVLLEFNAPDPKYQKQQAQGQIDVYNERINLLERAENEATKGTNTFDKNNLKEVEFYNKLVSSYTKAREYDVDEETLKNQQYTDDQIKQAKEQGKIKKEQIYYETILSFTNEKKQIEMERDKLQNQEQAISDSTSEYVLYAPMDGIMHLDTEIKQGMVIQGGSKVGTIAEVDKELIIEASIASSDRPRIHEGNEVSLAVAGLNQAEYGTLSGTVSSIDKDATIDKEGNVFFKVKIQPDKEYLLDKKGEEVRLTLGMLTETRVKYEKITYMKYFLEQIGINFS